MVVAEKLGKRFDRWLFRGLDFELNRGDSLVVLGRNGSGKSTLLKIVAGLGSASEGKATTRASIGYSALDLSTYPHLTGAEHLDLFAKLKGCPARTDELLQLVGLAQAKDQEAGQMSSGMRARLKLALAVQHEPELLILDEPGAGLDTAGRQVLAGICEEQARRGVLILATNEDEERRLGKLELRLEG